MIFYYYYCPVCGFVDALGDGDCHYCGTTLIETDVESDFCEYCINPDKFDKLVTDKYKITENPLYDAAKAKLREEKHKRELSNTGGSAKTLHGSDQVSCHYCKSTNVRKIGIVSKGVSVNLFGLASKKIGKQWHCKSCKSDF